MLKVIALVLVVLWLLGLFHPIAALGAFIHLFLVVAIALFVIDLVTGGRRTAAV